MQRTGLTSALAMALLLLAGCDEPTPTHPTMGSRHDEIVGGQRELGHPAVGALTFSINGQYFGSFCSATLIAPDWVLTAAHCTEGLAEQGVVVRPEIIFFYIGDDARPVRGDERPATGSFHVARAIHLHPRYTGRDLLGLYDIALIQLREPVAGVEAYPPFVGDLEPYLGDPVFYVGFGVNDGDRQTGGGIKRSVTLTLGRLYDSMYVSTHRQNGVCFGDSGGPGLIRIGGQWQVVGVNSSVAGEPICQVESFQTRVDSYQTWIRATMGEGADCAGDPAQACACRAACGADGVCDDPSCGGGCIDLLGCFDGCRDDACAGDCIASTTQAGQQLYIDLTECVAARCPNGDFACAERSCAAELRACEAGAGPPPDDALTCEGMLSCFGECGDDEDCPLACYQASSPAAQNAYNTLAGCVQDNCEGIDDQQAFNTCMAANCQAAWLGCAPSDGCRVTGGDCAAGTACFPGAWGGTYCEDAGDGRIGEACDPNALSCRDGAYCVGSGARGVCTQVCTRDAQCPTGVCGLIEGLVVPYGLCQAEPACVDDDGDTICADEDCDDSDADSYPGAGEVCDDATDQDCDGRVDEDCEPPCTDQDADGVCAEDDCDDRDRSRRPGARELCGDGIDQDCDGQRDEGCEMCVDADADGVCAGDDCDDTEDDVFPEAAELCRNDRDEDCDGQIDEGCVDCIDDDGDGYCSRVDCDDRDPEVGGPGPRGCDPCAGADDDGDGVCTDEDCDDRDPGVGGGACGDGGVLPGDGGPGDGGVIPGDFGIIVVDGGVDPDDGVPPEDGDGDSDEGGGGGGARPFGCACDAGGGSTGGELPVALVIGALGLARRRRARR